jgi:hypothetical protein
MRPGGLVHGAIEKQVRLGLGVLEIHTVAEKTQQPKHYSMENMTITIHDVPAWMAEVLEGRNCSTGENFARYRSQGQPAELCGRRWGNPLPKINVGCAVDQAVGDRQFVAQPRQRYLLNSPKKYLTSIISRAYKGAV